MSDYKIPKIKVRDGNGQWRGILPATIQPYNDSEVIGRIEQIETKVNKLNSYIPSGTTPTWFKDSIVVWYDPDRQGINSKSSITRLKDYSNNNRDLILVNFNIAKTPDQDKLYSGSIFFDGINSYGIARDMPLFNPGDGYTVIAKRKQLGTINKHAVLASKTRDRLDKCDFVVEGSDNKTRSFGDSGVTIGMEYDFSSEIIWQTGHEYNGRPILCGNENSNATNLIIGKDLETNNPTGELILYQFLLFNRNLNKEEIDWVITNCLKNGTYLENPDSTDTIPISNNNIEEGFSNITLDSLRNYILKGIPGNDELLYSHGVEWNINNQDPDVNRIGNLELHRTLPIHNKIKRCILNDEGNVVYYLNKDNSELKEDGTPANLDGRDGQVMVEIPIFYIKFIKEGDSRKVMISEVPISGYQKWGGWYISAYEATIQRSTGKLSSVCNMNPDYRGCGNQSEWDDTYRTALGRPISNISLTEARDAARKRKEGTEWNCYVNFIHKALYWLYVIEYATRNSQKIINSSLTTEGFHQGGLGIGTTSLYESKWNIFNEKFPFLPCGYTNSLGNTTGFINYQMPKEYDINMIPVPVISYRGIENPFGHIWKWIDGVKFNIHSESNDLKKNEVYISNFPEVYNSNDNYENYEFHNNINRNEEYISDIIFENGCILPLEGSKAGSSSTYYCDYSNTDIPISGRSLRGLLLGGNSINGVKSGLIQESSQYSPSDKLTYAGSRLCFIPKENLIKTIK